MQNAQKYDKLTEDKISAIMSVLSKGERVELIPTKDGVRVIRVRREEVKKADC